MTRSWINCCVPKINFCPEQYFFIGTFIKAMKSILELLDITPRFVWGLVSGDLGYTICLALLYWDIKAMQSILELLDITPLFRQFINP